MAGEKLVGEGEAAGARPGGVVVGGAGGRGGGGGAVRFGEEGGALAGAEFGGELRIELLDQGIEAGFCGEIVGVIGAVPEAGQQAEAGQGAAGAAQAAEAAAEGGGDALGQIGGQTEFMRMGENDGLGAIIPLDKQVGRIHGDSMSLAAENEKAISPAGGPSGLHRGGGAQGRRTPVR